MTGSLAPLFERRSNEVQAVLAGEGLNLGRFDLDHGQGGLSIVETIAVAHGGRAAISNHPGGGADVVVHLPPVNAEPEPRRATPPASTGRAVQAPAGSSQLP